MRKQALGGIMTLETGDEECTPCGADQGPTDGTDTPTDVKKCIKDALDYYKKSDAKDADREALIHNLIKIITCAKDHRYDLQQLIAEEHPELYFPMARSFITFEFLVFRFTKRADEDFPSELDDWLLLRLAYVLQRSIDDDKCKAKTDAVKNEIWSIVNIFLNQPNVVKGPKQIMLGDNWALTFVQKIIHEVAKTEVDPNFVFDLEDKLNSVRFGKQRQTAFSTRVETSNFLSTMELTKLLEKGGYKAKVQNIIENSNISGAAFIDILTHTTSKKIVVNWVPYAEQIPFTILLSLIGLITNDLPIEYVNAPYGEFNGFWDKGCSIIFSEAPIHSDNQGNYLTSNAPYSYPEGTHKSEKKRGAQTVHLTKELLLYTGFDALVSKKLYHDIKKYKLEHNHGDINAAAIEMIAQTHIPKEQIYYYGGGEFKGIAPILLSGNCRIEELEVNNTSFIDFLEEEKAIYLTGAIQTLYLEQLFNTQLFHLSNLFKLDGVVAHLYIKTDNKLNVSERDMQTFHAVLGEFWGLVEKIEKDNRGDEKFGRVGHAFLHDTNLNSYDFVSSDYGLLRKALKHTKILPLNN